MMFAPISTNPLHQKNKSLLSTSHHHPLLTNTNLEDDPLFFFEHDDGEPDYQNIQNHVSGETPRKSSFKV
jgi:hypothetical protein